jgi:hypothetical protein
MTADSDPVSVARVAAAIRGGRGRSDLYRWLWFNYSTLAAAWELSGRRADWVATTNELNRLGIRTRDKKRLKPESVRRTWARVDKDARAMGWVSATSAGAVSGNSPPGQAVPGVALISTAPSSAPSAPVSPSAGDLDPRPRKFGLAQLRGHPSSAPPPPPPAPEPERIRRSPEEVERIIADMMSGAPKNQFRRDKGD